MCKVRGTEEGPDEKQINEVGWFQYARFFCVCPNKPTIFQRGDLFSGILAPPNLIYLFLIWPLFSTPYFTHMFYSWLSCQIYTSHPFRSAVRVSLEMRAEWRVVRPTWSVVAASQWRPAPAGWITQLPAGARFITEVRSLQDLRQEDR